MNNAPRSHGLGTWLMVGTVLLVSALGCSRRNEASSGQNGTEGGTIMSKVDPAVSAAITRMEATGKLEGVTFEHFVGGGLPPPHYVANQLLLVTRDGTDTIEFAAPNYNAGVAKDKAFPNDEYRLPAQPDDVKAIARALREGHAFEVSTPETTVADAIRTELALTVAGKKYTSIYWGVPPELEPLDKLVDALTARARSQGKHEIKP